MEGDLGKLFVGGISWDTNEKRLKEYFGQYGEVVEAVIMRDRVTGRARGFGFVLFSVLADAERVVSEKHIIDGRAVEAKRAVPREDQHALNRNNNENQGSPSPGRVKKIFVGGLASTVTESDLKKYFDEFGTITDVVVMYDQHTKRPRGFGFISYDSEEAVDRVLYKTFHELNGKMVEVKRAVPRPGPNRSPLSSFNNYCSSRNVYFINGYPQAYNISSVGGYGSPSGFPAFGMGGFGMNTNIHPAFSSNYGSNPNFGNNPGRLLSPGDLGRYNDGNARHDSLFSSACRNVWSDHMNLSNSAAFLGGDANWSSLTSQVGGNASGVVDNNYVMGSIGYGRNTPMTSNGGLDGGIYRGSSVYGDSTWATPTLGGSGSLGFGLAASEVASKTSEGYIAGYGV